MILVDSRVGSQELETPLKRLGVPVEKTQLEFGDAAFEGNGPHGTINIGIERKTLHDMLNCIDDHRYSEHQLPGMKRHYDVSVLLIEGHWRPHDPQGFLMEGFHQGVSWGYCRPRGRQIMYHKLYRYLVSVRLAGVIVDTTRDLFHTAYNIHEWFHYFQKPWTGHTSLLETQKVTIPTLRHKPKLVRLWAADLEGVGMKMSELAEKQFKTGLALATAGESEWLRIPGIGVKKAQSIVKEIMGR